MPRRGRKRQYPPFPRAPDASSRCGFQPKMESANNLDADMPTPDLVELDRLHLIHPVTNFSAHEKRGVKLLTEARGVYLRDANGTELLDAFSGLWCVNTGYGQVSIVRVATEQMQRLPYATGYFGFGSEPPIRL